MLVVFTVRPPPVLPSREAQGRTWHRETKSETADAPGVLWLPDWERWEKLFVPWRLWDSLAHPLPDPAQFVGWSFFFDGSYMAHYSDGSMQGFSRERILHDEQAGEMHPTMADVWSTKH